VAPAGFVVKDMVMARGTRSALSVSMTSGAQVRQPVTFRSLNPELLRLGSYSDTSLESVTLAASNYTSISTVYAGALASEGTAVVEVSAPGVETARVNVELHRLLASLAVSSLQLPSSNYANVWPSYFIDTATPTRASGVFFSDPVPQFSVESSDTAVATISPASRSATASTGFKVVPVAEGTAELRLTSDQPGWLVGQTTTVKVTPPVIYLGTLSDVYLGKDLQAGVAVTASTNAQSLTAVVSVEDPSLVLVSARSSVAGAAKQNIAYSNSSFGFYLQGLADHGQTRIHFSVPGAEERVATVTLGPSGFAFNAETVSRPYYDGSGQFSVSSYVLDDATRLPLGAQVLRPGVNAAIQFALEGSSIRLAASSFTRTGGTDAAGWWSSYAVNSLGRSTVSFAQPTGFSAPSRRAALTVTVVPSKISLNSTPMTGKDVVTSVGITIGSAGSSTGTRTVTSLDPSRLLVSNSLTTVGTASTTVTSGQSLCLHGLTATGPARIRISEEKSEAAEFDVVFRPVRVTNPSFDGYVFQAGSKPIAFGLQLTLADGNSTWSYQVAVRPGADPLVVKLTSSDTSIFTVSPANPQFTPGLMQTTAFTLSPLAPGKAELRLSVPEGVGMWRSPLAVEVKLAALRLGVNAIGYNLQGYSDLQWTASYQAPDNFIVKLTSLAPDRLLLASAKDGAGVASLSIPFYASSYGGGLVYLQALAAQGSADVLIEADGLESRRSTVNLTGTQFALGSDFTTNITLGGGDSDLYLALQPVVTSGMVHVNNLCLRPGVTASVPVAVSDPAVLTVSPEQGTFTSAANTQSFRVHPVALGKASVTVGVPDGYATPAAGRVGTYNVVNPVVPADCGVTTIGRNTQSYCNFSPREGTVFSASSSDPSRLLVSLSATSAGGAEVHGTYSNGTILYFQALGSSGMATITYKAEGYQDYPVKLTLLPSAFTLTQLTGILPSRTLAAGTARDFVVDLRTVSGDELGSYSLSLRGGMDPVTVNLSVSDSTVLHLAPSTVTFSPGDSQQTVRLEALAAGSSTVSIAAPPGFESPPVSSVTLTVTK
jgi:hypothetical protein